MIKIIVALAIILIGLVVWAAWKEATFDYTECYATEKYRQQHRSAWVQMQKVGDVIMPISHPARDWTERLYSCPDDEGRFDKWRNESRP